MRKHIFLIILVIFIFFTGTSCGNKKNKLVGSWESADTGEIWDFFPEGTIVISGGLFPASGDYRFIDDNHIRLDLEGIASLAGPQIFELNISNNILTLVSSTTKQVYIYTLVEDKEELSFNIIPTPTIMQNNNEHNKDGESIIGMWVLDNNSDSFFGIADFREDSAAFFYGNETSFAILSENTIQIDANTLNIEYLDSKELILTIDDNHLSYKKIPDLPDDIDIYGLWKSEQNALLFLSDNNVYRAFDDYTDSNKYLRISPNIFLLDTNTPNYMFITHVDEDSLIEMHIPAKESTDSEK